jgi:uncharacterized protein
MDSISVISIGLGAFVGMMMALTGAGGGILSVPLLSIWTESQRG